MMVNLQNFLLQISVVTASLIALKIEVDELLDIKEIHGDVVAVGFVVAVVSHVIHFLNNVLMIALISYYMSLQNGI